jgi:hypothetical protein
MPGFRVDLVDHKAIASRISHLNLDLTTASKPTEQVQILEAQPPADIH